MKIIIIIKKADIFGYVDVLAQINNAETFFGTQIAP